MFFFFLNSVILLYETFQARLLPEEVFFEKKEHIVIVKSITPLVCSESKIVK